MYKKNVVILIGVLIIVSIAIIKHQGPVVNNKVIEVMSNSQEQEACYNFIKQYLMNELGGIYTNYHPTTMANEWATGHEVLSESQGLYMLYLVKEDKPEEFEQAVTFVNQYLINANGILVWRSKEDETLASSNAAIDDLRILRALYEASIKWNNPEYSTLVQQIEEKFYNTNIVKGRLYGCYDGLVEEVVDTIPLCYFDLETMWKLSDINPAWKKVYRRSLRTIEKGFVGKVFPFYAFQYDYETKSYDHGEEWRMTEGVLTILQLAQVGQHKDETIKWLLEKLKNGAVYGTYNTLTGMPTTDIESTAIYAGIAQIGKVIGNQELYDLGMDKMLSFQIQTENSVLKGAFGDEASEEIYSYDNLQALLAF